jgi:magnesium-transporting ATPase (P-type)
VVFHKKTLLLTLDYQTSKSIKKMELTIQTPALLFPALSLLLLAYTNKFLAIASLIRKLYSDYKNQKDPKTIDQIESLLKRLWLIRWMQIIGITSILFCVLTMFFVYYGNQFIAKTLFGGSLILMISSLIISILEITKSSDALRLLLKDMED